MSIRKINDGFKYIMQREVIEGFLNMCFCKVNLAAGTTSGKFGFSVINSTAMWYTINGRFYSLAATASGLPVVGSAGMSNVGSGQARLYALTLTSDGSFFLWAGAVVSANSAGCTANANGSQFATLNNVPFSQCIVGTLLISNAATTSWAVGSAAAGSGEFVDCFMVPQGVITSD
jgi:hypothetical protein